jgi:hypothetical protein
MSIRSKRILQVLAGALAIAVVSAAPQAGAQPAGSGSVLPTGGGQALIDTSDTVLLR